MRIYQLKKLHVLNTSNESRIGDVAEFLFDARAVQKGFIVNRPIHAGTIYDRVVECEGKFSKVQIKCTTKEHLSGGANIILKRNNNQLYPKEMVDVFAVYVLYWDAWYLFKNEGQNSLYITKKRWKDNLENWNIFYETV